jgi:hypothetical protein
VRLEHLLSGAQTNDDVMTLKMTRDIPKGLLLLAKRFYLIILQHKRKMKPGALATEPPRRKLSASPIAQLVRAPH